MFHFQRWHVLSSCAARSLAPIALAVALVACKESKPPASWPPGTVLAMNGIPIHLEEVDEVASWIAMVDPRYTLPHLRRIALTNIVFPKIAAQGIDPARRDREEAQAIAWRETLETKSASERANSVGDGGSQSDAKAPVEREVKGNYHELGMDVWHQALNLEIRRWSPVVESAGAFHIFQVVARGDSSVPATLELTVRMFDFPYLDPPAMNLVNEAIDRSTLVFVDESWRDFVPTQWQYRMHSQTP